MLVVTSFCDKDAALAVKMFEWCTELDGIQNHPCVLVASKGMDESKMLSVRAAAQSAFNSISIIRPTIFNERGWPESPNLLFRAACAFVAKVPKTPFLWLEPDCTPIRSGWLNAIESEYLSAGKPYMGFVWGTPNQHMTGVAVYPSDVSKFNPESLQPHRSLKGPLPFDVVDPKATLKHAHQTKLIFHEWGKMGVSPTFPTIASIDAIPDSAVLYHRVKDGSLVDRLREKRQPQKPSLMQRASSIASGVVNQLTKRSGSSIAIAYLYPCDARETFVPFAKRWAESYKRFAPTIKHEVIVSMSNGTPNAIDFAVFDGIPAIFNTDYHGGGWDIGNFQHIAKVFNHDLIVFMNSRAFFWSGDWLERFIEALEKFGPNGLYGVMASFESCPIVGTFKAPNPHIRTSCFVTNPKILRQFPHLVDSREQSFKFESGEWNVSEWYAKRGFPVKLVAADGFYDRHEWRKPKNIFRRGDQSNCLIADRHTLLYASASEAEKRRLADAADAGNPVIPIRAMVTSPKTITVVAATSLSVVGHVKAIELTVAAIPHPCEKLLISSGTAPDFHGKHLPLPEPWAKNGSWTLDDMCDFLLTGLHEYIATDVAIIVHNDGYAINKSKWTDDFLNYDYIGAPWPRHFPWTKPNCRVGNGGFSLRSKRWLQHASKLLKIPPGTSEDVYCGVNNASHFLKAGFKIAPIALAMRWSFEHPIEEFPNWHLRDSFGWHGRKNDTVRKHMVLT